MELKEEALAQVVYGKFMSKLTEDLPFKTFKSIGEQSAPGVDTLFQDAAELYEKNPDFSSSLSVAILRGAVTKAKHGSNTQMEEKLTNFYRFLNTCDKQATQVLSANLGGPSEHWLRRLDAKDRDKCYLDEGEKGILVQRRMIEAIDRQKQTVLEESHLVLRLMPQKYPPCWRYQGGMRPSLVESIQTS